MTNYFERDRVENEPLVQVEGAKSFGKFIGEGSRLWIFHSLRPYDIIQMGGKGKAKGPLKSIKDLDAQLDKKKGVKEDWQSVNKKDKTDDMSL